MSSLDPLVARTCRNHRVNNLRIFTIYDACLVSDIAIFVLKRDVKLQLTN